MFQREPGWVLPKGERDLTADDRAALRTVVAAHPGAMAPEVPAGEEPLEWTHLATGHSAQPSA